MATTFYRFREKSPVLRVIIWNVIIVLFLFYIDEGYYSFDWMKQPGNWIAFLLYFTGFLTGQCVTNLFILGNYKGDYKTSLTSVIGIPLGFIFILMFFYLRHCL